MGETTFNTVEELVADIRAGKMVIITDDEKRLFLCDNAKQFFGFGDLIELPYIKNMSE